MSSDTVRIPVPGKSARSRSKNLALSSTSAWQFVGLVWFVHLAIVQLAASLAYRFGSIRSVAEDPPRSGIYKSENGELSGAYQVILAPLTGIAHWIVEPFRAWDGTWYYLVANEGYLPDRPATAAFWPLYPWLMNLGHRVTGLEPEIIGYVVSNAAFLGALFLLFQLVSLDFDTSIARRTLWATALFPTAFFFNAIYTESLFLLLVAGSLYAARKGEWWVAGIVGLLAALSRSAGVMLLAPFAVLFIQQYGWNPARWFPQAFGAALPAGGPVIFGLVLRENGLKFLDWMTQQWQWNRFSATPLRTFDCALNGCTAEVRFISGQTGDAYVHPIDWGWWPQLFDNFTWEFFTSSPFRYRFGQSHSLELIVTLLAIAAVIVGFRLVPLYYTAFVIPALFVPLFTPSSVNPLMSMPRFVLPLFPLFVVVAILLRNRTSQVVSAVLSAVILVCLTMQFVLWYWVA